ncbi:MAG TPA: lytic transglycosylase domain-containing protein [Terriglobia bacterium]|nr:lytic transglycosylase domain-containing protein [Terriglobia bacterium]
MRSQPAFVRALLMLGVMFALLLANSIPSRAGQIASVVDEHGHIIFVNAADPPPPPTRKYGRKWHARYLATPTPEISNLVEKTADEHQVDPKLVHAIIQVESGYNPRAVSSKGAEGLMQLIPSTAERYGVQNTFNPRQNIEGGVSYLRYLLDLFKGNVPLTLAAYNAGENAVIKKGGIPPYAETVDYVQRVTDLYNSDSPADSLVSRFTEPQPSIIYRLVDARGVVHYTNGDGL